MLVQVWCSAIKLDCQKNCRFSPLKADVSNLFRHLALYEFSEITSVYLCQSVHMIATFASQSCRLCTGEIGILLVKLIEIKLETEFQQTLLLCSVDCNANNYISCLELTGERTY